MEVQFPEPLHYINESLNKKLQDKYNDGIVAGRAGYYTPAQYKAQYEAGYNSGKNGRYKWEYQGTTRIGWNNASSWSFNRTNVVAWVGKIISIQCVSGGAINRTPNIVYSDNGNLHTISFSDVDINIVIDVYALINE